MLVPSGGDTLVKLTSHLLLSDEVLFYLRGYVNFQNNGPAENHMLLHEVPLHNVEVGV